MPVAVAFGWFAVLDRLLISGGWRAVRSVGLGGRALVFPALMVGLMGAGLTFGVSSSLGPFAASSMREVLHRGVQASELVPGRISRVASLELAALEDQGTTQVIGRTETQVIGARQARIARTSEGPMLFAREAEMIGPGYRISAGRARWGLPEVERRVELDERSNPSLARVAARTEASGGDARYERTVFLKRYLHPLAVFFLPLCLLPYGLSRHRWRVLVGVGVLGLLLTRGGDLTAGLVGPWLSAGWVPLVVLGLGAVGWARWRDR
ncbi:MAG: LptF/LptG family permease [Deltaproteobacteria bacterium]|nr:MAG: LptF/LptG family permease [Deltaproteobacteria bacterium]